MAQLGNLIVSGTTSLIGNTNANDITATSFSGPLSGNATTATKLNSGREFKLIGDVTGATTSDLTSGINIITTSKKTTGYGECSTAGGTAAKVVTIANSNWTRIVGSIIGVKFTNSNSASNVTLNVNNTGAAPIWYDNTRYTGNLKMICGESDAVTYYMWNGGCWIWLAFGGVGELATESRDGLMARLDKQRFDEMYNWYQSVISGNASVIVKV